MPDALAAVIQDVAQRVLKFDGGLPTRGLAQLSRVSPYDRLVCWTKPGCVNNDPDFDVAETQQGIEQRLNAVDPSGRNIIGFSWCSTFQNQPVSADNITHVG